MLGCRGLEKDDQGGGPITKCATFGQGSRKVGVRGKCVNWSINPSLVDTLLYTSSSRRKRRERKRGILLA